MEENKNNRLICLGLEGTAEKTGIGIITDDGEVLFNKTIIYKPPLQGINPREAADHHAETFIKLLKEAFNVIDPKDIDLVSFSQGPGLGPSLRVSATAARALALSLNKPIIGVNHCVGHVEIGKLTTPAKDPLTLYVSGGNTQILAYVGDKYRVIGETHDIAIGNCLDQFARSCGLPHPGGVYIEQMAKKSEAKDENYLKLPYTIKGMDLSLSGLLTAAIKKSKELNKTDKSNETYTLEDVCYSLQETAFAMLTEITERALAHANKSEVMLVGGVAANDRLKEMLQKMCEEQNVEFYVPEKQFCGDNGAMIGWLGILQYKNGKITKMGDTKIMPNYRADMVNVNWIKHDDLSKNRRIIPKNLIGKGAEADIEILDYLGNKSIKKTRIAKTYRVNKLDNLIRQRRTVKEARFLNTVKNLEINTPVIYDVNKDENSIIMEFIEGMSLKDYILKHYAKNCSNNNNNNTKNNLKDLLNKVGESIAKMHNENIIHNDLTTSNFMVDTYNKLYLLDFGLAKYTDVFEDKAIDLIVLKKALVSTHYKEFDEIWNYILEGYKISKEYGKTLKMIDKVEKKGRYL
ncbi:bifunctional N(6)-L-threonylcarbamoyladenine synthase/serine/threonine protein kinase [Methanococcus voltae]|uniref:Probable bifunctional tRNA threonylcarbamoyladenosine biosynthesis protein n=1 Tax=Methanococcus voltae (strain ATCC BAA-1334 / A3) TaxID=456320 RepID=D7DR13_METV3|nr:bifunctional N(6)-L-threonylcarbamoyladenine synthase/serine/threonine protein kinase [Methanococcus voltae]MCS3900950.1 N6-L-threonylcarbamoyladenine synthase/protein kinase Bud32 [Methanococcus voltae]